MIFNHIKNISTSKWQKDALLTLLLGILSIIFRYVNFEIPGLGGLQSDLRELPLIIGIIHLTNPLFSIGLGAISSLNFSYTSSEYFYTFSGHAIPLLIIWFFFHVLKKQNFNNLKNALASLFLVFIYYLINIILIQISQNWFNAFTKDHEFVLKFIDLFKGVRYEIIYTGIAISFYFVQNQLRIELQNHEHNLEITISERTEHLNLAIKKLKSTQNHLVQAEKMASIGTLTAGVAHELNNPLNFISGGMNIIKEISPEIEKSVSDDLKATYNIAIDAVMEGLNRSVYIVKTLMAFSIKGESKLENHDINSIIDNTLLFMMPVIPKDIAIVKKYEIKELVPVYIEKMHQVFINILANAVFVLNRHDIAEKTISIRTFNREDIAIVEFYNSGPEIPSEYLNQIFDPFFTTKEPDKGKGLGLSICYGYILEHKGNIIATNTGKGVKFIIELPLNVQLQS